MSKSEVTALIREAKKLRRSIEELTERLDELEEKIAEAGKAPAKKDDEDEEL